jgi:peptide/nickel transport system substrate-binding protein
MRIPRITRGRSLALILLLVLLVPALAACGGPATPTTQATNPPAAAAPTTAPAAAPTTAPTTASAAAPTTAPAATEAAPAATEAAPAATEATAGGQKGGILRILYWQAVTILNPYQTQGTKDVDAAHLILEPLALPGADLKQIPYLAEEIPTLENGGVSKDLMSITWKLKKGVKWSDGTDFTADDVVFTWEYCTKSPTCTAPQFFAPISKVEAVDPNTVKITWKAPNANYYITFTSTTDPILQKKQFAECVGDKAATCPANTAPVGTGPYKLKEFKSGDVVTYDKNPMYRDADKVAFDGVELKGGGTAESSLRAVCETGETDYAWNLQVDAAVIKQSVDSGGKCDIVQHPGPNVERIYFNLADASPELADQRAEPSTKNPYLSDIKVRQALSMAIDRKTIAEQVYGPAGVVTCNLVPAPPEFNSPNNKCDQDVDGAKKLLEEAGWKDSDGDGFVDKDGKPLTVVYQTSINGVRQKVQQIIQSNWADIGVNTQLRAIDAGVFFSADKGNPDTAGHFFADVEMFTSGYDPDPTTLLDNWRCDQVAQKSNGWSTNNYNRYCSPEYDALSDQLHKETDPAKRTQLFIQLNDKLVKDYVIAPLIQRAFPAGKAKDLVGPNSNPWHSDLWNIAEWHK